MSTLRAKLIRLAHANPVLRPHLLTVLAATTPLPDKFPSTEIGLMTWREFLEFRNPEGKMHESGSYDYSVEKMNDTLTLLTTEMGLKGTRYGLKGPYKGGTGYVIVKENQPIAVIHKDTLYLKFGEKLDQLPFKFGDVEVPRKKVKMVKYLAEYIPLASNVAAINQASYPYLVQNLLIKGEPMQLRAAETPTEDKGINLAILNAEGKVVAVGQNEWGATLLAVAQEYRSKGLGQVIGKYWYEFNPSFTSGGFTPAGQKNALKLWEARVHEFAERGWYSELVKQGKLTKERVKEILSGLARPIDPQLAGLNVAPAGEAKGEMLIYADFPTVIVYDSRFLQEQDEKYIHGIGYFEDNPHIEGVFLYRIDYDSGYQKITTSAAMQMAKDEGEKVYIGEGYADLVELEGVPNVAIEGKHAYLTSNIMPLAQLGKKEALLRKRVDKYDEIKVMLLELAESKW